MNLELESDMKAAKLLDVKWVYGSDKNKIYYEPLNGETAWEELSLSDPATRDAVVQMLGEKYGCSIAWIAGNDAFSWFFMFSSRDSNGVGYKIYEEALRHAVMEAMNE